MNTHRAQKWVSKAMKLTLVGITGILGLSVLVACGGGGGGTTTPPTPVPTTTPVTKYAIRFTPNGERLSAAAFRQPAFRRSMGGSASDPVVLIAPLLDMNNFSSDWISDPPTNGTSAGTVNVSPQPSSTPSWQLTSPNSNATFVIGSDATATTAPSPQVYPNGINKAGSGTVTATIGTSTTNTNYYEYGRISIACTTVDPSVYGTSASVAQGGVQMVSGAPQPTNDPSNADLYVSGPNCFGAYKNAAETEITVHCPHGCVFDNDITQFMVTGSGLFTGGTQSTSFGVSALYNPTLQAPGFLEFKDVAGNIYKTALDTQNVTNVPTTGPYCGFPCMDGST